MHSHLVIVAILLGVMGCSRRPHSKTIHHEVEVTLQSTSSKPAILVVSLDSTDILCNRSSRTITFELEEMASRSGISEWKPWTFSFLHEDVPGIRLCIQQDRIRYLGSAYLRPNPLHKKLKILCTLTSQVTRILPQYGDPPLHDRVEACTVEASGNAPVTP